jgi:hypothetical protein
MPDALPDAELPPVPVGRGQQIIPRPPVWSLGPPAPWTAGAELTLAQVLGAVPDVRVAGATGVRRIATVGRPGVADRCG